MRSHLTTQIFFCVGELWHEVSTTIFMNQAICHYRSSVASHSCTFGKSLRLFGYWVSLGAIV